MNRRMLGKGGTLTPEAGVCTPYSTAIPVTSGLVSYTSVFNSCNNFQSFNGTSPITATTELVRNSADISGSSNPMVNVSDSVNAANYIDNGSGDVYWERHSGTGFRAWSPTPAWRFGTDVSTAIILCNADDVTSSVLTRIGFHNSCMLRYVGGNLSCLNGGVNRTSTITGVNNTWVVLSLRTSSNIVVGQDKVYENVLTSFTAPTGDFSVFAAVTSPTAANWDGRIRDIALYSGSLSNTDTDTMVDYMKAKWGL
jgi:hypothetical protein